jgi:DNA-directed RNA polymerase specialized sigma24 family protein
MSRDELRTKAEAELSEIHSRFRPAVASTLEPLAALRREIEAADASLAAEARRLGCPCRVDAGDDWKQQLTAAIAARLCGPGRPLRAVWAEAEQQVSSNFAPTLGPLENTSLALHQRMLDEDVVGTLDGKPATARTIYRSYRKALRGWILRWRDRLRTGANLDPQFVGRFSVDFFTHQPEPAAGEVAEESQVDATDKAERLGSAIVAKAPKGERRAEVEAGLVYGDGLSIVHPDDGPARATRAAAGTVPVAEILRLYPKKVQQLASTMKERDRDMFALYYVRHLSAEDTAEQLGLTADHVRASAKRISDMFDAAGLPRPRHERQVRQDASDAA